MIFVAWTYAYVGIGLRHPVWVFKFVGTIRGRGLYARFQELHPPARARY